MEEEGSAPWPSTTPGSSSTRALRGGGRPQPGYDPRAQRSEKSPREPKHCLRCLEPRAAQNSAAARRLLRGSQPFDKPRNPEEIASKTPQEDSSEAHNHLTSLETLNIASKHRRDSSEGELNGSTASDAQNLHPSMGTCTCGVLHDYSAQADHEMSLKEGQVRT
jgi:hypothetical protein